jgi:hypothetical protein
MSDSSEYGLDSGIKGRSVKREGKNSSLFIFAVRSILLRYEIRQKDFLCSIWPKRVSPLNVLESGAKVPE